MNRSKLFALGLIACATAFTACDDDDDDNNNKPSGPSFGTKTITQDISANTTWSKDTVYILDGRIKVRPNVTLTIQPGTIIKGESGQAANATVLMVMRDATIMAEGTPTEPIIFTSILDGIEPGDIESPTPNDLQGQWGGLAILGNAKVSTGTTDPNGGGFDVDQIEGVPSTDTDGLYGGNDDNDSSGKLAYVSVRHGGTVLSSGDELNGISFGGVGRGTEVHHIEIVANADDGVEFYGGTVNVNNLLVWNNGDDAIDTDQGYSGTIDNFIVVAPEGSPFELDGPEGADLGNGDHTIKNGTVVASRGANGPNAGDLINFDDNTNVTVDNVWFTSVVPGQLINSNEEATNVATITNITIDVDAANIADYVSAADASILGNVAAGTTSKANSAEFTTWSWAGVSGSISSL